MLKVMYSWKEYSAFYVRKKVTEPLHQVQCEIVYGPESKKWFCDSSGGEFYLRGKIVSTPLTTVDELKIEVDRYLVSKGYYLL